MDFAERGEDAIRFCGLREEMQNHLAIDGGLKNRATLLKVFPEGGSVDKVPIVRNRDLTPRGVDHKGLSVHEVARARR